MARAVRVACSSRGPDGAAQPPRDGDPDVARGDRRSASRACRPGDPVEQLQAFELKLVDMLWEQATPQTARDVADKTWDLVHDRSDEDTVKRRVIECHEALARLSARSGGLET